MSASGLQTFIRNCVFQGNVVTGNESALTISESSLTVINKITFEENVASLGGAVKGKSIQMIDVTSLTIMLKVVEL